MGGDRQPAGQVHRLLFLERFGAEHPRRESVDREHTDVFWRAADDVGDDLAEVYLAQARRAEPGAASRPQRDAMRRLIAKRQLARHE